MEWKIKQVQLKLSFIFVYFWKQIDSHCRNANECELLPMSHPTFLENIVLSISVSWQKNECFLIVWLSREFNSGPVLGAQYTWGFVRAPFICCRPWQQRLLSQRHCKSIWKERKDESLLRNAGGKAYVRVNWELLGKWFMWSIQSVRQVHLTLHPSIFGTFFFSCHCHAIEFGVSYLSESQKYT
jgi:hypothetical protein